MFWWRAGPHYSFALALVPPETTGPDYRLSQEDECSSASFCNLWLGQFDWHPGRKPDALGLYQPTFKTFFVVFSEEFQAIVEKKKSLAVISHVASCHGVWHFFCSFQRSFSARGCLLLTPMSNGLIQSWIFSLSELYERVPCHERSRSFYYIWTVVRCPVLDVFQSMTAERNQASRSVPLVSLKALIGLCWCQCHS